LAASIGVAMLPSLQADAFDKKTTLTISEPLEVPSCCTADQTVTLQPGEYVIVLVDSLSDRHIVRIFDKAQKVVIATVLAIPNYRLKPTGKTVFQFWEVPAGQPRSLRAWFYPGDNFGQEFAYPKQTAAKIAAFTKTPVPAIDAKAIAMDDLKTVPIVAIDESGKTTELVATLPEKTPDPVVPATLQAQTPVQAETPPVVAAAPVQAADRAVEAEKPAEAPAPAEPLPATASAMPLVGLAGLVSLAMFAALGFLSRRRRPCKA
jgi:LPXTG-motif cell wall-anchored protein